MTGLPSSSSSASQQAFTSRLLLLLTLLPLTLAFFAFLLQWRGGLTDPLSRWSPDPFHFPGSISRFDRRSAWDCVDLLGQSRSPAFPYFKDWKFDFGSDSDLRPQVIGVSTFFLFVDGKAASPSVSKVLESIPRVKVIYRTKELEERQAKSRIWDETWLASFFYKPCNYELFVKQSLNMEMAIVKARDAGMDSIIHLDTDELIHPVGAREYSLRQLLSNVPGIIDMVVFSNYESSVERDDIKEPFTEISMFKKNYDHLLKGVYFGNYKEATRGNPNYFLTYGNGKSAARIQDHLRPNGAHRWHNYMKTPNEIKLDEASVLHYTYPKFSDLTSRHDRCGCKPTREDVKRCFMLEFDRAAFIIASTATEEEMLRWYHERVVWTDKALNLKFLRKGILTRIYAPMAIIQGLRESGVFNSVVQSAQTTLLKDTSVESSNSSKVDKPGIISSRKIDVKESQATARRILEITDKFSYDSAIPPLSPPVLDLQIVI
ncbi:hypothetical protein REPUB_Repub02eG0171000 [Reevesia pubescens]